MSEQSQVLARYDRKSSEHKRFVVALDTYRDYLDSERFELNALLSLCTSQLKKDSNYGKDGVLQGLSFFLEQLSSVDALDTQIDLPPESVLDQYVDTVSELYRDSLSTYQNMPMLMIVPWEATLKILQGLQHYNGQPHERRINGLKEYLIEISELI